MKILITGSPNYYNYRQLSDFLNELKNRYENKLIIVSGGGSYGIEQIVKKVCKYTLNIKYIEFPIRSKVWNLNCEGNGIPKHLYNQEYNPRLFHERNARMVDFVDLVILFGNEEDLKKTNTVYTFAKKKEKKFVVY